MGQSQLQTVLETLVSDDPEDKVRAYFQPPESLKMVYPCIRYEPWQGHTAFAGNLPYRHTRQYTLTIIDLDPESYLYDLVAALPMCVHNRRYVAENLNHDVFQIYF